MRFFSGGGDLGLSASLLFFTGFGGLTFACLIFFLGGDVSIRFSGFLLTGVVTTGFFVIGAIMAGELVDNPLPIPTSEPALEVPEPDVFAVPFNALVLEPP